MQYIISAIIGMLVFGLLAMVLIFREQRRLKKPAPTGCGNHHGCQCQTQGQSQKPTPSQCANQSAK